jgi:hypothetical protein
MATISEHLEELSRKSAAELLRRIPISYKDIARLSPTIVIGVGRTGHQVLDDLKEYVRDYSLFLRDHFQASQGVTGIFTTELIADAVQQPLALLSLPYIDGSSEVTSRALESSEILATQVSLPPISEEVLNQYPDLALWIYPDSQKDMRQSANAKLIIEAVEARLRLYFTQGAVTKSLRDALNKSIVLKSDISHAGLIQAVQNRPTIKIFLVASISHPSTSIIPDIVARASALAKESLYSEKIGIVLLDDTTDDQTDVSYRDGARCLGIAAANTITRGYTEFKSHVLDSSSISSILPSQSPVGAVYILSRNVGGRELSGEDTRRAATLLLFHAYYEKYPLSIWSDRIYQGDPIISGFGTASMIFPWRFIKSFSLQFILGSLYRHFESEKTEQPSEEEKKLEIGLPDIPSSSGERTKNIEKSFASIVQASLLTNRRNRGKLLRDYLEKIDKKLKDLEEQKSQISNRINQLEERKDKIYRFYKKLGYIALGSLPPLCGAIAALLAEPANLFDYLNMPGIIGVGTGIGALLGGAALYVCVNVLGKRAVQQIEEDTARARSSLAITSEQQATLESFKNQVETLSNKVEAFYLLHDELRSFEGMQLGLPVDERQVPSTTVYLLVDKLCPPSQNPSVLYEYLLGAEWLSHALEEAKYKYKSLIAEQWGKELWAMLRDEKKNKEIDGVRTQFTLTLAEVLASFVDTNAHIGEGIVTRTANILKNDVSKKLELGAVLTNWAGLSRPTLPVQSLDPSQINRYLFISDDVNLIKKNFPEFLYKVSGASADPRLLLRFELIHGLCPWELAEFYKNRIEDDLERFINWINFSLQPKTDPIEVKLACNLLVGIKERLDGINAIKAEEVYALDIAENLELWRNSEDIKLTRFYASQENTDLRQYAERIDQMANFYTQLGKKKTKTIAEYATELRFRPKDELLWSIILDAANQSDFFLQSLNRQMSFLKDITAKILQGSNIQTEIIDKGIAKNWEEKWVKEGLARLQKEIPDVALPKPEFIDKETDSKPERIQSAETWRVVAESMLEAYIRETLNYLTITKSIYLACVSDGKYGLKRARILVLHRNGERYNLGFSIRELIDSIRNDRSIFREIAMLTRPWLNDQQVKLQVEQALKEITKEDHLWDQPFSYWLS